MQTLGPMHIAQVHANGHIPLIYILRCAPHTKHTQIHKPHWAQTIHAHIHRWFHMILAHHRQICIDFPASPVIARWWDSPRGLSFNALINLKKFLETQSLGLFQMSQAWPSLRPRREAGSRERRWGASVGGTPTAPRKG